MDKSKLRKLKVHAVFGGALTLVFLVSVIWRVALGERLLQASWNAFREISPLEWVMIFGIWYSVASQKPQDEWSSNSITTLGLSQRQ